MGSSRGKTNKACGVGKLKKIRGGIENDDEDIWLVAQGGRVSVPLDCRIRVGKKATSQRREKLEKITWRGKKESLDGAF